MLELLFGADALWFSVPALAGTIFFLSRVVLMMVGAGFDLHHDVGASLDLHHGDSSEAFKILSIQSITAFMMGFGWAGLFIVRGVGLPVLLAVPVGMAGGTFMAWMLGRAFRLLAQLQSSGSQDISVALAEEGTVYVAVPARRTGRGSVRVVVADRQQYYSAVTDSDAIPTGTRVRVLEINDDHTLTVEGIPAASLPPAAVKEEGR